MKKQSKFSLNKIKDFLYTNTSILVIVLVLFSFISLMLINGFKIDYESLDTDPPVSVLVEDRVPALALYYQRERVNVNIVLANPEELEEWEVLDDIVYAARYNSHRRFDEVFVGSGSVIPTREKHLFTHFSLTPGGDPLDPAERITEEITVYANWIPKPKINPWQVLARIALQIELGTQSYIPYQYSYHLITKGGNDTITLPTIDGLTRETYDVKPKVVGTETKEVVDFLYNYNRINRHTVTFNLNGGKLPVSTQRTEFSIPNNGMVLEFPGVTRDNHRFLGWSLAPDGDVLLLQDIVIKENKTLYAIFMPSVPKPNPSTNTGRYQTTYMLESIDYDAVPVALMAVENIGTINEEIAAEPLELAHFEEVPVDKYSHKSLILGSQFLIVPKKDKVFNLNQKVMSFTETNVFGIITLLLIFSILVWTFIDNRNYNMKFLGWGILALGTAIMVFVLPQLVRFSVYFKNIWEISKTLNPDSTKITMLSGIKLSGSLLIIASLISFASFIITFIADKKTKEEAI